MPIAHTYGNNIDTDRIIPGKYTKTLDIASLAAHVMEDLDPDVLPGQKQPSQFRLGKRQVAALEGFLQDPENMKEYGQALYDQGAGLAETISHDVEHTRNIMADAVEPLPLEYGDMPKESIWDKFIGDRSAKSDVALAKKRLQAEEYYRGREDLKGLGDVSLDTPAWGDRALPREPVYKDPVGQSFSVTSPDLVGNIGSPLQSNERIGQTILEDQSQSSINPFNVQSSDFLGQGTGSSFSTSGLGAVVGGGISGKGASDLQSSLLLSNRLGLTNPYGGR